ncbi:hypothetical protein BJY20_000035 [Janibacter cremeus]|uniref:Uncharacterized protein n=1 Tax=Janibacter cremeus TaxID=1285192 RepID=A0A852VPJ4_9MICO|nr:hypothetical protein [Janibacter cremeus]
MHHSVSAVTTPLRPAHGQALFSRRAVDLMRRGVSACRAV